MNGYQYKAVLKSGMCESVETSAATLTVNATSAGGTVATAQTICYGSLPGKKSYFIRHTLEML